MRVPARYQLVDLLVGSPRRHLRQDDEYNFVDRV